MIDRLSAALADRYRVVREIGAGGMATVYLAHDLKHERDVAIKVLHPDLGAALGGDRFLSEIRTTARLQHPHILPLLDSGDADGLLYYVMPFVTGETLRARLDRERPLGIDEAVRITREVADALGYAHSHAVIHRDIKPENILLQDGHALVADFGIALAVQSAGGQRMTQTGLSLGTPQYMSPEQAMGERAVTARSDIYALGAVAYEMLAGDPPFSGSSVQAIVAKVMTERPSPIRTVRDTIPIYLENAVLTALAKLPADRFATASEFVAAIEGRSGPANDGLLAHNAQHAQSAQHGHITQHAQRSRPARSRAAWLAAIVIAGALSLAAWNRMRAVTGPQTRFIVGFPRGQALDLSALGTHVAVSLDGGTIVYTGGDSVDQRLLVKKIDELHATPIPGTEGGFNPFISPDGQQVGFFTGQAGYAIKVVALSGGPPQTVLAEQSLGLSGAAWATDGYIYFDADDAGIHRVKPDGTGVESVMRLDSTRNEIGFAWPQVLPGNKIVIARVRHRGDTPSDFDIVASRIGSGEHTVVVRAVTARYAAGNLFFVTADGALQSAPFDERRLAVGAKRTAVASAVRVAGTYGGADLALSNAGSLFYVSGPSGVGSRLQWVDTTGATQPVDTAWRESGEIVSVSLSPDGKRAALSIRSEQSSGADLWIKELPAGPMARLTLDSANDYFPSWSHDGKSVLFISTRVKPRAIFIRRADSSGDDSLVASAPIAIDMVQQSADGQWIIATARTVVGMQAGRDTALRILFNTPKIQNSAAVSPDGHHIAYVSNFTGDREVYVRPFPDMQRGVQQVSTDGGSEPTWSADGKTLYYRAVRSLAMLAADVRTDPTFTIGTPRVLFYTESSVGLDYRRYDVTRDKRFLMIGRGSVGTEIHLVQIQNVMSK